MTTATRLMTADELLALPKLDVLYELIDGELHTMPPAGERHGEIGIALAIALGTHVRQYRLGRVYNADTGYRLRSNPDTVRSPDISFVARERLRGPVGGSKYFEGAPDLAVEVLSPSDTVAGCEEKLASFFAAGCRLAWMVDPGRDTLAVYVPPATRVRVLGLDDVVDGGEVVPGFSARVRDLLYWPD